jgi:hypothetical protein
MKNSKDWKKFDIAYQCENQPTTKELFENLDELGFQIMGTGELLLRTAKKEITKKEIEIEKLKLEKKQLALRLEQINKPLEK